MKRTGIVLTILLVCIVVTLAVLLFSVFQETTQKEVFIEPTENQNQDINSKKSLIVRGDWEYPPFEYINEKGQPDGFNIEIIRRIAQLMNLKIEIDLGPWDTVRRQLEQGEIDILAGMYKTEERDKLVDFTIPHFISSYGIFVRKDSGIDSHSDIQDKKILVQEKDLGHDYLVENGIGAEIITVNSWEKLLPELNAGRADCAVLSMMQGARQMKKADFANIRLLPNPLFQQRYCIAVKSGDADLLATLNEGLNLLKSSGEYDEIFERWFGVYSDPSFSPQSLFTSTWVRLFLVAFLLLALLLLGSVLWTYSLRREVAKKTSELSTALEELRQANTAKNRFLASVSHELRTPLHGIIGMVRLLKKSDLDAEQQNLLEMLSDSSIQLHRVLSDLIDATRIETGRFSLHPTDFSLRQIGTWVEPLLRRSAEKKGLEFYFVITDDGEILHADQERLVQIILNLGQNAVKNTSEGSVEILIEYSSSNLRIRVADTGRGIPPEQQEAIFTPFTQLENSLKVYGKQEAGLGLGLSIVKTITNLMKGNIELESSAETGTTIQVTLPVERGIRPADTRAESEIGGFSDTEAGPKSQAEVEAESEAHINGQSEGIDSVAKKDIRILIAEDEAINRLYLERFLQSQGWGLKSVANGKQALDILYKESFDVVLMDLGMPELGGIEAASRFREYEHSHNHSRTKIVALTAYADEDNRRKCIEAGMDGFVSKPFKEKEIVEEIRRLV